MSEIRHDYIYAASPIVASDSPCAKNCNFVYKTSLPEHVNPVPACPSCGQKMKLKVLSKEVSENQWL